jgi:hypothetical protein
MRFVQAAIATVFATVPLLPAAGCDIASAPTTRWAIVSNHGVDWLRTPCGDRFYSLGVNALDGGYPWREHDGKTWYSWVAFAPSLAAWVAETQRRLTDWGFNSAGGWSLPPQTLSMPTVVNLELGRNAEFHWFDPFDSATERRMMAKAKELVAPYRNSPYRIGYFSDNEVGWWAGALFVFYSMKPADSFTKQRWVAMLRDHYASDWRRFTVDFIPPGQAATASPRCANGPASSPSATTRSARRRSAPPTPTGSISATGCRSTTTRPRSRRWRATSMRSPPTTTPMPATAGSRITISTGWRSYRAASRYW